MKRVDIKSLEQYLTYHGCLLGVLNPTLVHVDTVLDITCRCSNIFNLSVKKLGGYKRRGSPISCGCVSKKWTNDIIDIAISDRNIQRHTDCNVNGFQPSVSPILWKCGECTYSWRARVDSVINKRSGCPNCAGNAPYTVSTLFSKLCAQGRTDIIVNEIFPGSFVGGVRRSRRAAFMCTCCNGEWTADIHNVVKFGYGCPACNDNVSTRVEVDGLKFHSKLEYYFWKRYHDRCISYKILRQHKYLPTRRLTCDYYIPEKSLWIEVTGGSLMKNKRYSNTIEEKRCIVNEKGDMFVTLVTVVDINSFINTLEE